MDPKMCHFNIPKDKPIDFSVVSVVAVDSVAAISMAV